jgi:hypothetical protein
LKGIPVSVLFHILSHNLLKISSEDDLFFYISAHLCSDPEYLELLQVVRFEYLSVECISSFLSALSDSIDPRLWESISRRLISPVSRSKSLKEAEFPSLVSKSFEGIISYLTRKHGGNAHEKGIVTITSKSVDMRGSMNFSSLADLRSESHFCSRCQPGQWVCWDFHEMRVRPTHYTIRSPSLTSWVLESSLDGEAWTVIDWKEAQWAATATFAVSNSAECRFIRLTQTGPSSCGMNVLSICALEVFGTLLE